VRRERSQREAFERRVADLEKVNNQLRQESSVSLTGGDHVQCLPPFHVVTGITGEVDPSVAEVDVGHLVISILVIAIDPLVLSITTVVVLQFLNLSCMHQFAVFTEGTLNLHI